MPQSATNYDFISAIDTDAPGCVTQREDIDAVAAAFAEHGYQPLAAGRVLQVCTAATGPFSTYPTGLPRFADSNPDPVDGWALDAPGVC